MLVEEFVKEPAAEVAVLHAAPVFAAVATVVSIAVAVAAEMLAVERKPAHHAFSLCMIAKLCMRLIVHLCEALTN